MSSAHECTKAKTACGRMDVFDCAVDLAECQKNYWLSVALEASGETSFCEEEEWFSKHRSKHDDQRLLVSDDDVWMLGGARHRWARRVQFEGHEGRRGGGTYASC